MYIGRMNYLAWKKGQPLLQFGWHSWAYSNPSSATIDHALIRHPRSFIYAVMPEVFAFLLLMIKFP